MKRIASTFHLSVCQRRALLTFLFGLALASATLGCAPADQDPSSASATEVFSSPPDGRFVFPRVDPEHRRMTALLENALGYIAPDHGTIEPASGYPVEGWNHDPKRGLYLRSFTQLTAIGQWIELLANIAAGYADNPYISREEALERLAFAVKNLRHDQHDSKVSAKGLLGNFLGFDGDRRVGPLARDVIKQDIVDAFGEKKAAAIWQALKEVEWIKPENQDQSGVIQRSETYGLDFFMGELAPFGDDETRYPLMEIMDQRIVMVAYGDNANLATSVAKAIGALLSPSMRDSPLAAKLRIEMEQFLDDQKEGYEFLYDEEAGMLSFGWNASTDRYFGWEDGQGNWTVGHSDYLVNEFRGPTMFVLLRYDMPAEIVSNLGFKIKPYTTRDGRLLHSLSPWEGSAFQALGLSLAMREMENPTWSTILRNVVDIEVDYADRHRLPGFLSESYSGDGTEYTGSVGIPEITVSPKPRVTDAPSIYTLGVAYSISPDRVERLLEDQWSNVSKLMTEHGPWEGYNTTSDEVIEFQTTAHVLSLILGGLGTASENMGRYLDSKGLGESLQGLYASGEPIDFLHANNNVVAWSPDGSPIASSRSASGFHLEGSDVGEVGITIGIPDDGANLSGGSLLIRYRTKPAIDKVVIKLDKKDPALDDAGVILSEIFTRLPVSGDQTRETSIPLPATPGLRGIKEIVILCGDARNRKPIDVSIIDLEFNPAYE